MPNPAMVGLVIKPNINKDDDRSDISCTTTFLWILIKIVNTHSSTFFRYPKDLKMFQVTLDNGRQLTVHLTIHNSMYDHECPLTVSHIWKKLSPDHWRSVLCTDEENPMFIPPSPPQMSDASRTAVAAEARNYLERIEIRVSTAQ